MATNLSVSKPSYCSDLKFGSVARTLKRYLQILLCYNYFLKCYTINRINEIWRVINENNEETSGQIAKNDFLE